MTKTNAAILGRLTPVIQRAQRRRTATVLACIWGLAALIGLTLWLVNRAAASPLDPYLPNATWWVSIGTFITTIIGWIWARQTQPNIEQVARQIENEFPDLDATLLTALEQKPDGEDQLGYLQTEVIRRALHHSHRTQWENIVPDWQLGTSAIAALLGFVGVSSVALALWMTGTPVDDGSVHRFNDVVKPQQLAYDISVQPGDTEVEKGSRLLVMAQFKGDVPPSAELSYTLPDGTVKSVEMTKSLDDPVFAGRISQVKQPIKYTVHYSDKASNEFNVSVFEFPRLERSDADLKFPEYTKREEKHLQDVRRITAVVGTEATFKLQVNKPLKSATLVPDEPGEPKIVLTESPGDPKLWISTVKIDRTRKYRLQLDDAAGRNNKTPPRFAINALENQPPSLKLVEPSKDVQVSAIEEVNLSATAWDDFGLQRIGVSYSIGGDEPQDLVIDESKVGKKKHPIKHLLELERLKAVPDQLIAYHFWAEDLGPDGTTRRTASDMYFAEVRPFEEIYRQGQGGQQQQQQQQDQQNQQGNQNAQQASQLAELQKEIINATWRVIRRETRDNITTQFESDVQTLIDSQQEAFAKADELIQKLEDDETKKLGAELQSIMSDAIISLTEAKDSVSVKPLSTALRQEQAAYQTLLKMRAREFEVQQQQMSQQQMQQQQQNQQNRQMQQLQMQQQEDRYEQERQAQEQQQQSEEQRENRQILSRLRELARRQNDLNERIKELQSALEEAETEEEQEEIERQLKRLEEEQRQILRDADELQERMQQEQNQQQMAEQSEQMQQARDQAQRSAESLKEGNLSQAAAEGTRAERELKELRDEFQKRTSGQFVDEMRQMRNEARDLEKKQQELAEDLRGEHRRQEENRSLTAEDKRDEIVEAMREGRESVEQLRDQMKQTIEEAEEYEPLLADKLYDAYRESEQSRPDRALDSARRSLQRGLTDVAESEHQRATQGIEQLREGIDEAAESVLGDETEALKLARNSIEQLNRQLENEMRREHPEASRQSERGENERGETGDRQGEREAQSGSGDPRERDSDEQREDQESRRWRGEQGEQRKQGERREQGDSENKTPGEGQSQPGNGQGQPRGEDTPADREDRERNGERGNNRQRNQSREQQDRERQNQQSENQRPNGQQPGNSEREGQPQGQGGGGQNQPQENQSDDQNQRDQNQQRRNQQQNQNQNRRGGNRLGDPRQPNRQEEQRSRFAGGITGGNDRQWAPLTGDDYREWSDMLRDVEEMMADPELRAEAARIRDRARAIRRDLKRHSAEPNWELIKLKVVQPLAELEERVGREILRRDDRNARVPLNREPVPTKYEKAVQRYYEQIGAGK